MIPHPLNPFGFDNNVPLTFTAVETGTVELRAIGSPNVSGLHYRLGTFGNWLTYIPGTVLTLQAGKSVQFWNSAENLSNSGTNYVQYIMSGKISAKGNTQSLLNYSDTVPRYGFYNLFSGCSALISAAQLPATSLNTNSYAYMFLGCDWLISAPKLPAINISGASGVYYSMFSGCSSIVNFPQLPATQLETYCYYAMFRDCISLKIMPKLSNSNPPAFGYTGMFRGCTQLESAIIPFSIAGNNSCCNNMFYQCSALNRIEVSLNSWSQYTTNWVSGVSAIGTFIKPAALTEQYGISRIPTGWTVINK